MIPEIYDTNLSIRNQLRRSSGVCVYDRDGDCVCEEEEEEEERKKWVRRRKRGRGLLAVDEAADLVSYQISLYGHLIHKSKCFTPKPSSDHELELQREKIQLEIK